MEFDHCTGKHICMTPSALAHDTFSPGALSSLSNVENLKVDKTKGSQKKKTYRSENALFYLCFIFQ